MNPHWAADVDVVVVGSGVAGLSCALDAAQLGRSVLVVTKADLTAGSTRYAQGGVAVADAAGDSVSAHAADTLLAGAGLADPVAVDSILADGPDAVRRLVERGARFDRIGDRLLRTREGGHRADRIVHAGGDATGAEIERALAGASGLPAALTEHLAIDVALDQTGAAVGVYLLDPDGRLGLIRAGAVVLATGGAGQLYAASTNPAVATADGVAMALRAGAVLADIEFVQFHPTALWTPGPATGRRPLVTEALRGTGAVLVDGAGRRIMPGVHPLGDLAPRDVVSSAVTRRLADRPGGIGDHVFLDATLVPDVGRRFPSVTAACRAVGVDPAVDLIPVSPAAHYLCGGVWTDLAGATTVPGLFAAGEVARTGLHGANRLASNSLLEGLVMARRVALAVASTVAPVGPVAVQPLSTGWSAPMRRAELQSAMSRQAGIGRDERGLRHASRIADRTLRSRVPLAQSSVEATNLAQVSSALLAAASRRTESRGCHLRTDQPAGVAPLARSLGVRWSGGPEVLDRLPAPREQVLSR